MESFQTAPVIRFYRSDTVPAGEESPAHERPGPDPLRELPGADLRLVPARRASGPGRLVALAAVAGLVAVALATWAFVSAVRAADDDGGPSPAPPPTRPAPPARPNLGPVLALLVKPSTERYRVDGSAGRITLAVTPNDRSYLVLNGLGRAPRGKVYRAWVIPPAAGTIRSGATFLGSTGLVPLRLPVREGGAVAITLERAGPASGPSRTPRLVAVRGP